MRCDWCHAGPSQQLSDVSHLLRAPHQEQKRELGEACRSCQLQV